MFSCCAFTWCVNVFGLGGREQPQPVLPSLHPELWEHILGFLPDLCCFHNAASVNKEWNAFFHHHTLAIKGMDALLCRINLHVLVARALSVQYRKKDVHADPVHVVAELKERYACVERLQLRIMQLVEEEETALVEEFVARTSFLSLCKETLTGAISVPTSMLQEIAYERIEGRLGRRRTCCSNVDFASAEWLFLRTIRGVYLSQGQLKVWEAFSCRQVEGMVLQSNGLKVQEESVQLGKVIDFAYENLTEMVGFVEQQPEQIWALLNHMAQVGGHLLTLPGMTERWVNAFATLVGVAEADLKEPFQATSRELHCGMGQCDLYAHSLHLVQTLEEKWVGRVDVPDMREKAHLLIASLQEGHQAIQGCFARLKVLFSGVQKLEGFKQKVVRERTRFLAATEKRQRDIERMARKALAVKSN